MITCALSTDQIKDLRVYNIAKLKDIATKGVPFDLKNHIKDIYNLIYENTKDRNTALDYARLSIVLTSSAAFNVKALRVLLDKGLDYNELVRLNNKVEDPDSGLQTTVDYLGLNEPSKDLGDIISEINFEEQRNLVSAQISGGPRPWPPQACSSKS